MDLNFKKVEDRLMRNINVFATRALIIGLLATASCLPEPLEVKDIPKVTPEIVVSSQIIPDQSLLILLTKTIGALDASDDTDPLDLLDQIGISDATVTVTGPSGVYTLQLLQSGVYVGTSIDFEVGQEYTLKIVSQTLGEVTAKTKVQALVPFNDVDASLYYNGFGDTLAQITYSINDPGEKNWYMINVQEVEREDAIENSINPRAFTRLVNDELFNGKTYSEQFRVFPRDYNPGDTIAVSVSNISKEYYEFMQLRIDNRFSFIEFLSEPVNYPSNVQGGKGFFNLYLPDVRVFVFED